MLAGIAWRESLKHSGSSDNQDTWMLNRLLVEGWASSLGMDSYNGDDADAVTIFRKRFKEAWPGGFGALFARYFVAGAGHPLSRWWPREF
jgi:hypothetical protein